MTTYPLSEPASIVPVTASGDADPADTGRGRLEECVAIVAAQSADRQRAMSIRMDSLDLEFGPDEIGELLQYLGAETGALGHADYGDQGRSLAVGAIDGTVNGGAFAYPSSRRRV